MEKNIYPIGKKLAFAKNHRKLSIENGGREERKFPKKYQLQKR